MMSDIGKMALGSRLRILGENMMRDAQQIYQLYDVDLKPKWFPVFYLIAEKEVRSITQIASAMGHTHPSVSKTVREMMSHGVIYEEKDMNDGRRTNYRLTDKGDEIAKRIQAQYKDVHSAVDKAIEQSQHNLWLALNEFETQLDQKSMFERVVEQKKKRERTLAEIVEYDERYREAYRDLNVEWIQKYFVMEESDFKALDHPEENVLKSGGRIVMAVLHGVPVGACAMIKMNHEKYDYELAKMAVSPKAQGIGIGTLLGKAIIDRAKEAGAKWLYLESNTVLEPAINLYRKLGFVETTDKPSPYERCNIQMELNLEE